MVCALPRTELVIAMQVERDPLEEMVEIVDAKTPPLEHLEFIVQAFHEAATLALAEIVGNQVEPGIEQRQKWLEACECTGFHLLAPRLDATDTLGFGASGIEDGGELFAEIVGLLKLRRMAEELR